MNTKKTGLNINYLFVLLAFVTIGTCSYLLCTLGIKYETYYISSKHAPLRRSSKANADIIEILTLNKEVRVVKKGKVWWKVKTLSNTGYIHSSYLASYNPEIYFYRAQAKAAPILLATQWMGNREKNISISLRLRQDGNNLTGTLSNIIKNRKTTVRDTINLAGTINYATQEITLIHNSRDGTQQCLHGHLDPGGQITGEFEHIGKGISFPISLQPIL